MAATRTAREARRRAGTTTPVLSAVPARAGVAVEQPAAVRPRAAPYLMAIALSGVLLFTLELLAGRLVLPVFGGSPGVWTTTLCFFTTVVLAGYVYAHLVATRLTPARGGALHLGLAVVAIALTVLAPRDVASLRDPALPEVVNVLLAQAVLAGPAAFLLATTSPLLSAWFARRGGDPWWLYAVSNAASFGGLLLYPFLLEPFLPLSMQRFLIAGALVGFVAALGVVVLRSPRLATVVPASNRALDGPAPTLARHARWLFAAFVPAGLLSATTNHLATDLVSSPFIWIGPLAVYLLSFVVAFSASGRSALPVIDRLAPGAAALLWVPFFQQQAWPMLPLLLVELGALWILATAIHGRLALDRPGDRHLTRFYVVLSAGGMLATAFVAVVAPLAFNAIYEYPLLIVAGLAALALLPSPRPSLPIRDLLRAPRQALADLALRAGPYTLIAAGLVLLMAATRAGLVVDTAGLLIVSGLVMVVAVNARLAAASSALLVALLLVTTATEPLLRVRTFFGVVEVRNEGDRRSEYSGTTLHGTQYFDEARRLAATSYYVAGGPMGDVFDDLRGRVREGARVGVVGLGVGTALAYAVPGDDWTFFEIDQAVIDIARDERYFTYLRDAPAPLRMVLGDARLSLEREPPGSLDVLVVDAFSSDAVPVHLLTREALQLYHRVLRPGGIVLLHLSNRHYDLIPVANATARSARLGVLALAYAPGTRLAEELNAAATSYVIVGDWPSVERFRYRDWSDSTMGAVFTDDFANLLSALE